MHKNERSNREQESGTTCQVMRPDLPGSVNKTAEAVQCKFSANSAVQREANIGTSATLQSANQTGMPNRLKSGMENLSGYDLSAVRVHYNSPKPEQLGALAYAQGTNIHLSAGQEKHLPHEAWHVVQQMQGRVRPTLQMKSGVNVNDDGGLEKEADVMGGKAMQNAFDSDLPDTNFSTSNLQHGDTKAGAREPIQRFPATALQSAEDLDWEQTETVSRPNEGISGGVYIFSDTNGPINDLVVKPEYLVGQEKRVNREAEGQVTDKLLRDLRFNVPNSRIASDGESEIIIKVASDKGQAIPPEIDISDGVMGKFSFLKIMGKATAKTFSAAAKEANTVDKMNDLLAVFNRSELMKKIGKLIAADVFMNNSDRISDEGANLGNLMFHENELTAIDTGGEFKFEWVKGILGDVYSVPEEPSVSEEPEPTVRKEPEPTVREKYKESLFLGIKQLLPNDETKSTFEKYLLTNSADKARADIDEGITLGFAELQEFLNDKESMLSLKEDMKRYKSEGATKMKWSILKGRKRHIDYLARGIEAKDATKYSDDYGKWGEKVMKLTISDKISNVPAMPAKIGKLEKIKRKLSIKNDDEKRASEYKNELRKETLDLSEIDIAGLENAGRRGEKVVVLYWLHLFSQFLKEATSAINALTDMNIGNNPREDKMIRKVGDAIKTIKEKVLNKYEFHALLATLGSNKTSVFVQEIREKIVLLQKSISKFENRKVV